MGVAVTADTTDPGWHRGDWMQTFTGRKFYPTAPLADDIDIVDIAHALSHLCRYAGHVDRFYSVAEHCVKVSEWVEAVTGDTGAALEALLHDATEAYVVDVPRPLKVQLPDYRRAEGRVQLAVWQRFGLPTRRRWWGAIQPIPRIPVEQSWIDDAALAECIDEWLPDFIAAVERPLHPDSGPLLERAVERVRSSFQDTYGFMVGDDPERDINGGELLVAQEQTIQILYGCAAWIVANRSEP
jgi:hypothetical protein